jgi:anti-anti-sigma factor
LLCSHLGNLVASHTSSLLLNLADLTQVDSSGISAIVGTFVTLKRQAASLKLLRPRGQVRSVLHVVRLLDIIPTFEDEAEALASFRPRGYTATP